MSDSVLKDPFKLAQVNKHNEQERFEGLEESIQRVNSFLAGEAATAICAVEECIKVADRINSEHSVALRRISDYLRHIGGFETLSYDFEPDSDIAF